MRPKPYLGEVFYEGPSQLTGDRIVALLSYGPTTNRKTGREVMQTWILNASLDPGQAVEKGADASVCGSCVYRIHDRRVRKRKKLPVLTEQPCYVLQWAGPASAFKSWRSGRYAAQQEPLPSWARLRAGSYGDPVAVPYGAWSKLIKRFERLRPKMIRVLGYTQQWRDCDQRFRSFCMASVQNERDAQIAAAHGWRWYRSRPKGAELITGEIECPAAEIAGYRLTCDRCMACHGSFMDRRVQPFSVSTPEH